MGGQTQINAVMRHQILRTSYCRPAGKISGGGNHRHLHIGRDAHRNHVLIHLIAHPYAGIKTLGGNVGQLVPDAELNMNIRVLR